MAEPVVQGPKKSLWQQFVHISFIRFWSLWNLKNCNIKTLCNYENHIDIKERIYTWFYCNFEPFCWLKYKLCVTEKRTSVNKLKLPIFCCQYHLINYLCIFKGFFQNWTGCWKGIFARNYWRELDKNWKRDLECPNFVWFGCLLFVYRRLRKLSKMLRKTQSHWPNHLTKRDFFLRFIIVKK